MRYNLYNKLLLQLRCNDLDSTIKASTCTMSKYYSYMFYADRNVRPCTILGYTLTTFPKSLIQTKTTKRTSTELQAKKEEGPCIIGGESGQRRKRTLHRVWCCAGHPALQVYHCRSAPVCLWPFWAILGWVHFGHSMSKVCHLICRCYIVKRYCDIICDITAPHICWSCDLLL